MIVATAVDESCELVGKQAVGGGSDGHHFHVRFNLSVLLRNYIPKISYLEATDGLKDAPPSCPSGALLGLIIVVPVDEEKMPMA